MEDRAASLREVAGALGVSPATVRRAERRALEKLAAAWAELEAEELSTETLVVAVEHEATRRDRLTDFCRRLMSCAPHEAPADEPPGSDDTPGVE